MQNAKLAPFTQQYIASGIEAPGELRMSSFGRLLFWAFAIYLVVPLVDVPLIGLSPSAFLIFLVALEVFLGNHILRLGQFKRWNIVVYFLWLGFMLSIVGNVFAQNYAIGFGDYILIIRVTFWLISFLTTMVIAARLHIDELRVLVILLGLAIIFLGWVRLYEGIAFGRWGGGGTSSILTQNTYGILFSRFTPFAVALYFILSGILRQLSILALVTLFVAIAANGSRSSWIAVSAGLITFSALYTFTQPHRASHIAQFVTVLLILVAATISFLPFEVLEPISSRFATLENIEEDKSFMTRQVMVQKSQRLFEANRLFGAGLGRFNKTRIDLELPDILRGSKKDFNRVASHNSYAKLLGETGISGVIPFSLLILSLALGGLRAVIRLAPQNKVWMIAIYASFVAMSIHMWTIDNLNNTAPWFVYGLVAGLIERGRQWPKTAVTQ